MPERLESYEAFNQSSPYEDVDLFTSDPPPVQALHHARQRTVFQKRLAEQPLMQRVLSDMAVEVEAATALVMRLARSFDLAATDAQEAARARLLTPAVKFWICKRAPVLICEAMECLGGNGAAGPERESRALGERLVLVAAAAAAALRDARRQSSATFSRARVSRSAILVY